MTAELAALLVFVGVLLLVVGPYYLFVVRIESVNQDMLRQRIRTGGGVGIVRMTGAGLLKEVERFSAIGPLNNMLAASGAAVKMRDQIQLAGLKVTPGQLLLGSACLAMLGYVLVIWWLHSIIAAAIAGIITAFLPIAGLRFACARQLIKFESQFPEAVDLIARTLRAGHAFTTGLGMVAEELPQPVASEFKLLFDQQNYGLPLNEGLRELARRVPIIDARFFVTAVLTQRESGGNLAEVLDNLSGVIRERFKIKRQLRVLTAHGRVTGMVLASLPPVIALYMFYQRPDHFHLLLNDPLGIKMVISAGVMQIIGAFLIYKISDVKY